jgi:pimeloyl-ACP methyl ester carboxylesterase
MDLRIGPMTQGHVVTDDGVQLLYQTFGQGPPVVFANGIGVRYPGAIQQIEALRGSYRVICWDYRGMGQSVMPDPAHGDVSMARHAIDSLVLLDHLRIDAALFIGWSMGVQVALEVIRRKPERVAGFVALLGSYGKPFSTGFPSAATLAIKQMFHLLHRHPRLMQFAVNVAVAFPRAAFAALSALSFVGPDADPEVFAANVLSMAGVDTPLYLRTLLALADHDALDVLPRVRCPSLIICGERDYLTPPKVARHMADSIPNGAYKEVSRGTHFALIEQPELVNSWLLDFAESVFSRRDKEFQP